MKYRARLGWSNGPSAQPCSGITRITSSNSAPAHPPNVNFECTTSGGTLGGGTLPCAINNFTYIQPAWDTIDLSFGYNTGDIPASDYLKRITLQLTVHNLMGKHAAFEYGPNSTPAIPQD